MLKERRKDTIMGTWGTGFYQNDLTKDIKSDFLEHLKKGKSIKEAEQEIIIEYRDLIGTDEEGLVWIVMADMEWTYGVVESETLENAKKWLEIGVYEEEWKEVSEKEYLKWKSNLDELKARIEKPNEKPKKIRKFHIFHCKLIRGGMYAYQIKTPYLEGTNYFGKYVVFVKVAETNEYPGNVVPVVKVMDGIWDTIPEMDQVNQKKYLPLNEFMAEMPNHPDYILGVSASSERKIPYKEFVLLGTNDTSYDGIDAFTPFYRPLFSSKAYCPMAYWNWYCQYGPNGDFDVYVIRHYACFHGLAIP